MKRIIAIILLCAFTLIVAGCSSTNGPIADGGEKGDGDFKGDIAINGAVDGTPALDAAEAGGGAGGEQHPAQTPQYVAGTLTAGEWKDADNLSFWKKLLNRNDWYQLMETRNLYTNDVVTVFVHDAAGNPCYNVVVTLDDEYTARTDVYGKAYLLRNINGEKKTVNTVTVGEQTFDISEEGTVDITLESTSIAVQGLDLMLMIDTTGSMGDELEYLQTELANVINRVADANTALSIQVSVNFYRDAADEYVIRPFEFTGDIAKAVEHLKAQRADGGGDYPEAVHIALENAIKNHPWRNDAVKLMFFVLDAPPHSAEQINGIDAQMLNAVICAAAQGIRIIPVASSGVNTETEFLLRSWALMTGGTYTFLTDHSGVGGEHLEPTIGEYTVQKLNDLMVDLINEYCGKKPAQEHVPDVSDPSTSDFSGISLSGVSQNINGA